MAKKPPPPPSPPASSSEEEEASSGEEQPPATSKPEHQTPTKNKDDEDEESEDESEEESDDDEEEPRSDNKKPQPSAAASAPAPSKPASDSGSGSGSESEDDSDSEAATAKLVTPISSRPMADGPVAKEAGDGEKPNGKTLFQRIWTPDDEIAILNAMADFEPEHGLIKMNANAIGDFLRFVKDSLSIGVSGTQLVDKIRRLKKRYSVVAARAKSNGKGLKFATAHDQVLYELSKKVWGKVEGDDEREMVANGKANRVALPIGGGKRRFPLLKEAVAEIEKKTGNRLVVEALETIDSEKAGVLEKKFKKQKIAEIKHHMHELDLMKETLKLVMEGAERAMD